MASSLLLLLLPSFSLLAVAGSASSPSCVCTRSECEEVREWECPGGGVVWDACGCCRVCARVEDEPCGGPDGFHGSCAPGLHCVLDVLLLLHPPPPHHHHHRTTPADARGTCKRVPGVQVGASPGGADDSREGTGCEDWPAFGCDIVGRVCRCSRVSACGGASRGRRRRRRGGAADADRKSPFTFSSLEECEMNLAEVLRQEEAGGRDYSLAPLRNCSNGCPGDEGWDAPLPEGRRPCPVGSAPRTDLSGSCVCLPSLCPSAYLPFTCPFGARVLRRASRLPGDCCDLYECASPPVAPPPASNGGDSSEEASAPSPSPPLHASTRASQCPQQEAPLGATPAPPRPLVVCDIVGGRACRCTRLPSCEGKGRRRRRRRKGGGGLEGTFHSLDECKERLSRLQLRTADADEDATEQ